MSEPKNAATEAIVSKYLDLSAYFDQLSADIENKREALRNAEARRDTIYSKAQDCFAAARALEFDLRAEATLVLDDNRVPEDRRSMIPMQVAQQETVESEDGAHSPSIKEFVLKAAEKAYPSPVTASVLRLGLLHKGTATHEKTVGMTLYRLLRQGLLRREGHKWFFVPPEERTGNSGGDTPEPNNDAED